MSLAQRVVNGLMVTSGGAIGTNLAQVVTALIIINALGARDYGELVLALSLCVLFNTVLDPGIRVLIISEVARERGAGRLDRVKRLILSYGIAELMLSLALGTLLILFAAGLTSVIRPTLWPIVAFYLVTTSINNMVFATFQGYTDFGHTVTMQMAEAFGKLALALVLVLWLGLGVTAALLIYPMSAVLGSAAVAPAWVRRIAGLPGGFRGGEPIFRKTIFSHGKYIMGVAALGQIKGEISPWILRWFVGIEAVAIYGVAMRMLTFFSTPLQLLQSILFPMVSELVEGQREKMKQLIYYAVKYSLWASLASVPLLYLGAPILFQLVFRGKYQASVPLFQVLLLGLLPLAFVLMARIMFFATQATGMLCALVAVEVLVYVPILGLLVSNFGVIGVAWAIVLERMLSAALRVGQLKRAHPDIIFYSHRMWRSSSQEWRELVETFRRGIASYVPATRPAAVALDEADAPEPVGQQGKSRM